MSSLTLDHFKVEELQIILGHLKLGIYHLQKQLTPQQFKELENCVSIPDSEKNKIRVNKAEIMSQILILINTVFTGFFGIWFGLAKIFDIDVTTNLASVGELCLIFGFILGIALLVDNYRKSKKAIRYQKIQRFRLEIFQSIHNKKKQELTSLIEKQKERYEEICNKEFKDISSSFENKEDFFSWFYLFHNEINERLKQFPNDRIFEHSKISILEILKMTSEVYFEKAEFIGNFAYSLSQKIPSKQDEQSSVLDVLTNPLLSVPKIKIKRGSARLKIFEILLNLFPTFLGAFGSILMWCNSSFVITEIFSLDQTKLLIPFNCIFYFKMLIAFLFTVNYVFFCYFIERRENERKNSKEILEKELLNKEAVIVQMDQKINLLQFLDLRLEEIIKHLAQMNIFKKLLP